MHAFLHVFPSIHTYTHIHIQCMARLWPDAALDRKHNRMHVRLMQSSTNADQVCGWSAASPAVRTALLAFICVAAVCAAVSVAVGVEVCVAECVSYVGDAQRQHRKVLQSRPA